MEEIAKYGQVMPDMARFKKRGKVVLRKQKKGKQYGIPTKDKQKLLQH